MSKFWGLVHSIENLKKEIDEIQKKNEYIKDNEKNEIKNLYTICNRNYIKLSNEITHVNVKREELWKSIRDIQEYLISLGILKENDTEYSQFILEELEIPKITKEIHFLNNKLEFLDRDARKNDIEYEKYEGFGTTL